jgi:hypothetical protein
VEPGRKSGLSPKAADLSKELYEDFLCEVFSLRDVSGHPEAERVNAAIMALVQLFESAHVFLGSLLRQLIIGRRLRCLGFGCGHVSFCSGTSREESYNFRSL